jgi:curved DNA-binding protein CbpA
MNINYYDFLEIDSNATQEEIKKAYRKKAVKLHPDKGGNEKDFSLLNEAYQVLSDEEARRIYDATGKSIHNPIEIEEEANSLLVGVFDQTLDYEPEDFKYGLLDYIKEDIESRLVARKRDVKILEKAMSKLERMLNKIKRKTKDEEGGNIFNQHIKSKIKTKQQDLSLAHLDIKIIKESLRLLDDYECEKDKSTLFGRLAIPRPDLEEHKKIRTVRGMPIVRDEDVEEQGKVENEKVS